MPRHYIKLLLAALFDNDAKYNRFYDYVYIVAGYSKV